MQFWISCTGEAPNLESLPVADIVDYPLEPAEYKPFAQARLCLTPSLLLVEGVRLGRPGLAVEP